MIGLNASSPRLRDLTSVFLFFGINWKTVRIKHRSLLKGFTDLGIDTIV